MNVVPSVAEMPVLKQEPLAVPASWGWAGGMLVLRSGLFAVFQGLISLVVLAWGGAPGPPAAWRAAQGMWTVVALLGSATCLPVLIWRLRREGGSYRALLVIERRTLMRDALTAVGLLAIAAPLILVPGAVLAGALFGGPQAPTAIMFPPLPLWIALVQLAFPVLIALSELPTYFGYVQPRIAALTGRAWLAVALSALGLAAQHMALPLVLDGRFLLYRFGMFLPFALLLGAALHWRPRLLPYLMVGHGLLDLATAALVLSAAP